MQEIKINKNMSSELTKEIHKQLIDENNGEKILIIRWSEMSFWAFEKQSGRIYWFMFDKTRINEHSDNIDLWIVVPSINEYMKYSVPLKEYVTTASGKLTIVFAEQYINKFTNDKNKLTIK